MVVGGTFHRLSGLPYSRFSARAEAGRQPLNETGRSRNVERLEGRTRSGFDKMCGGGTPAELISPHLSRGIVPVPKTQQAPALREHQPPRDLLRTGSRIISKGPWPLVRLDLVSVRSSYACL